MTEMTYVEYLTQWLISQGTSPAIARYSARNKAEEWPELEGITMTYAEWEVQQT